MARVRTERERAFLEYLGERVDGSLFRRSTTPQEVEKLCRWLIPHKSMGWDGVSPRVIRMVALEISPSFSMLFNFCMRESYYPSFFKITRVLPVFKGKDPTEFSKYRPVSVLPVLSQLFEPELKERDGEVTPVQYGFREGHSTTIAILDMVERVRVAWGRGNVTLGVFIDLKRAFFFLRRV